MSRSAIPSGSPSLSRQVPPSDRKIATTHVFDREIEAVHIVKRANTRDVFGLLPSGGGACHRHDAFGDEDSLSKSNTDRDLMSGPAWDRSSIATGVAPLPRRTSGSIDFRQKIQGGLRFEPPHAKGPVFFWIGSSARRAFGGCLGSKRR